ncbi:unnamed protein product [Amoebophrya sp. A25]|nr:unnamed protein product [Amoebophrya sp. A25]|eukprot:GSA25T00006946001.1
MKMRRAILIPRRSYAMTIVAVVLVRRFYVALVSLCFFYTLYNYQDERDVEQLFLSDENNCVLQGSKWERSPTSTNFLFVAAQTASQSEFCQAFWLQAYEPAPFVTFLNCVHNKFPSLDLSLPLDCWCENNLTPLWRNMYTTVAGSNSADWMRTPVDCCKYSGWANYCTLDCNPDCNDARAETCRNECLPLCLEDQYRTEIIASGQSVCNCGGCWDKIRCIHDHAQNRNRPDFQKVCDLSVFERSIEAQNYFNCVQRYPHATTWEQATASAHCVCEANLKAALERTNCCAASNYKEICSPPAEVGGCADKGNLLCRSAEYLSCKIDCERKCDHIQDSTADCYNDCLRPEGKCYKYQKCEPPTAKTHDYICDDTITSPDLGGCCVRHDTTLYTSGNVWCPRFCATGDVWYVQATQKYVCDCQTCPEDGDSLVQFWRNAVGDFVRGRYKHGLRRIQTRLGLTTEKEPERTEKLREFFELMISNAMRTTTYEPGRAVTDLRQEVWIGLEADLKRIELEAISLWMEIHHDTDAPSQLPGAVVEDASSDTTKPWAPNLEGVWRMTDQEWALASAQDTDPALSSSSSASSTGGKDFSSGNLGVPVPAIPPSSATNTQDDTPFGVGGGVSFPTTSSGSGFGTSGSSSSGSGFGSSSSGTTSGEDYTSTNNNTPEQSVPVVPTSTTQGPTGEGTSSSGSTASGAAGQRTPTNSDQGSTTSVSEGTPFNPDTEDRFIGRTQIEMQLPSTLTGYALYEDEATRGAFQMALAMKFGIQNSQLSVLGFLLSAQRRPSVWDDRRRLEERPVKMGTPPATKNHYQLLEVEHNYETYKTPLATSMMKRMQVLEKDNQTIMLRGNKKKSRVVQSPLRPLSARRKTRGLLQFLMWRRERKLSNPWRARGLSPKSLRTEASPLVPLPLQIGPSAVIRQINSDYQVQVHQDQRQRGQAAARQLLTSSRALSTAPVANTSPVNAKTVVVQYELRLPRDLQGQAAASSSSTLYATGPTGSTTSSLYASGSASQQHDNVLSRSQSTAAKALFASVLQVELNAAGKGGKVSVISVDGTIIFSCKGSADEGKCQYDLEVATSCVYECQAAAVRADAGGYSWEILQQLAAAQQMKKQDEERRADEERKAKVMSWASTGLGMAIVLALFLCFICRKAPNAEGLLAGDSKNQVAPEQGEGRDFYDTSRNPESSSHLQILGQNNQGEYVTLNPDGQARGVGRNEVVLGRPVLVKTAFSEENAPPIGTVINLRGSRGAPVVAWDPAVGGNPVNAENNLLDSGGALNNDIKVKPNTASTNTSSSSSSRAAFGSFGATTNTGGTPSTVSGTKATAVVINGFYAPGVDIDTVEKLPYAFTTSVDHRRFARLPSENELAKKTAAHLQTAGKTTSKEAKGPFRVFRRSRSAEQQTTSSKTTPTRKRTAQSNTNNVNFDVDQQEKADHEVDHQKTNKTPALSTAREVREAVTASLTARVESGTNKTGTNNLRIRGDDSRKSNVLADCIRAQEALSLGRTGRGTERGSGDSKDKGRSQSASAQSASAQSASSTSGVAPEASLSTNSSPTKLNKVKTSGKTATSSLESGATSADAANTALLLRKKELQQSGRGSGSITEQIKPSSAASGDTRSTLSGGSRTTNGSSNSKSSSTSRTSTTATTATGSSNSASARTVTALLSSVIGASNNDEEERGREAGEVRPQVENPNRVQKDKNPDPVAGEIRKN